MSILKKINDCECGRKAYGFKKCGVCRSKQRLQIWNYDKKVMFEYWLTSEVTEIVDSNNFNTIYSKYTWKYENE